MVQQWLNEAKSECGLASNVQAEALYGGSPFITKDTTTFWRDPVQFYNWWKNNIERKSKLKVLQDESIYEGQDSKKLQR